MDINTLKTLVKKEQIVWRNHILIRMRQRKIKMADIINSIKSGTIIESYKDDYPYPSVLVSGKTIDNTDIHVVCAVGQEKVWMITAYYPDTEEWFEDLKTRRE